MGPLEGGCYDHLAGEMHSFALESAYLATGGEPSYTVCTSTEQQCTDYIFYSQGKLRVAGTMEVLDAGTIQAGDCLPSEDWPSHHVSLLALMDLKASNVLRSSPI